VRARYTSFAASFLLVLGVGTVLALAARSGAVPPSAALTATATATGTATATAPAPPTATAMASPTATATATAMVLRYNRRDTAGGATAAGSYAFLEDASDLTSGFWTARGPNVWHYRYSLEATGQPWGPWQNNGCTQTAVSSLKLTGLDASVTYSVRLQARNARGWGASATVTATTASTPTPTPTATATATGTETATAAATATPAPVRYNRLDATGAVTAAGSYAFLGAASAPGAGGAGGASGASGASGAPKVLTTWEDLHSEATTLRVHQSDAGGASRAAEFGEVATGDIVEWRKAADCWVRYRVTAVPARPASGSSRWEFPVEWLAYAATGAGCTGTVPAASALDVDVDSSAVIQSPEIVSPVRYGPYLLYPPGWTGALEERALVSGSGSATGQAASGTTSSWPSDDPAVVRRHSLWSDPDVPDGWTLGYAWAQSSDRLLGFYDNADGVHILVTTITKLKTRPAYHFRVSTGSEGEVFETRMIDGHPALLKYDPARSRRSSTSVKIFNRATGIQYTAYTVHSSANGLASTIAIARSLYQ